MEIVLFKINDCNLCTLMQLELIENPVNTNIRIVNAEDEISFKEVELYNIVYFPTTLLLADDGRIINRFEGFINSESINVNIKNYETEHLV